MTLKAIRLSENSWMRADVVELVVNDGESLRIYSTSGGVYLSSLYTFDEFLVLIGWKFKPIKFPDHSGPKLQSF